MGGRGGHNYDFLQSPLVAEEISFDPLGVRGRDSLSGAARGLITLFTEATIRCVQVFGLRAASNGHLPIWAFQTVHLD